MHRPGLSEEMRIGIPVQPLEDVNGRLRFDDGVYGVRLCDLDSPVSAPSSLPHLARELGFA